jgi:hypothetical protein
LDRTEVCSIDTVRNPRKKDRSQTLVHIPNLLKTPEND